MDVKDLQNLLREMRDISAFEVLYSLESGIQIARCCYVPCTQQALTLISIEEVAEEWRESMRKSYPKGIPCLDAAYSLDRNATPYGQPSIQLLPKEIAQIRPFQIFLPDSDRSQCMGAVSLTTKDSTGNQQLVLGYVTNNEDLDRILAGQTPIQIQLAGCKTNGTFDEIRRTEPILRISALSYAD